MFTKNKVIKYFLQIFSVLDYEKKKKFFLFIFISITLSILDSSILFLTSRVIGSLSKKIYLPIFENFAFLENIFLFIDPKYRGTAFLLFVLFLIAIFRVVLKLFYRREVYYFSKSVTSLLSTKMFNYLSNLRYIDFLEIKESDFLLLMTKDQRESGLFVNHGILFLTKVLIVS